MNKGTTKAHTDLQNAIDHCQKQKHYLWHILSQASHTGQSEQAKLAYDKYKAWDEKEQVLRKALKILKELE